MEGVNLGGFLNQFAANPQWLPALIVFLALALPLFGYVYNRWIDRLQDHEHISFYVVGGVTVTLLAGALLSWKASLLMAALFALSGSPMIAGEIRRTNKKVTERTSQPRRKRLPYAANGRIDDATMAVNEGMRLMGMALKEKDPAVRALQMATASHELGIIHKNLLELKVIQQIEE